MLTEAETKQAAGIFTSLKDLYAKVEASQDTIAHRREGIRDIYATLEAMRAGWGGGTWNQTKDFESLHDQLLEDANKHRKKVLEAMRASLKTESQIRASRAQVEHLGAPGVGALASWAKGKDDLPEGLLVYLNRQLAQPRFSCTPVPAGAVFPSEAELGAPKAGETRALLDDLVRQVAKDDALASDLAQSEAERGQLEGAIKDLDAHWAWRTKSFAWSMDHLKLKEQRKKEAREGIEKSQAAAAKASRDRESLASAIEILLAKLDALPPDRALVVDGWRLKQAAMPVRVEEAVEAWTRKALGLYSKGTR